jgi:hypothetical protein
MIEFKTYQEVDLSIDPIVVLPCLHVSTISSLDAEHIGQLYLKDQTSGEWILG